MRDKTSPHHSAKGIANADTLSKIIRKGRSKMFKHKPNQEVKTRRLIDWQEKLKFRKSKQSPFSTMATARSSTASWSP